MVYRELVSIFSRTSGRTFVESKEICDQVLHIIMESLKAGESISIYGFGTLEAYRVNPRKYILPITQEHGESDGRIKLRFKAGKKFLSVLNGEMEDYDDYDE